MYEFTYLKKIYEFTLKEVPKIKMKNLKRLKQKVSLLFRETNNIF